MLGLTQADLAAAAGISKTGLIAFETAASDPKASTLSAIQRALEAAGVDFTNGEQPGVRLRKTPYSIEHLVNVIRRFQRNMPSGSEWT
jgi:transcriptional regulator with XRE-family HTH domain